MVIGMYVISESSQSNVNLNNICDPGLEWMAPIYHDHQSIQVDRPNPTKVIFRMNPGATFIDTR